MCCKGDFLRITAVLGSIKVAYLLLIMLAAYTFPEYNTDSAMRAMMRWPQNGEPVFASHFATWDSAHYLYLSEVGYKHGEPSCAFYPLWPIAIRNFSMVTGGNDVLSAMILANLFSCIAWAIFYFLVRDRFGTKTAQWALILLILFPGSLFFQFAYTESLFFLLLMILWWGLEKDRPMLIGVSSFLLPMTRAIGIFCILPIFWHLFGEVITTSFKMRTANKIPWNELKTALFERVQKSWLLLIPFLGWGVYFLFMWSETGNVFEGFDSQHFWGAHSVMNIVDIPKFLIKFCQITDFHSYSGSFLDRCVFLLFFCSLFKIYKLGKDMAVWALILGVLPATSGDLMSFTRFCSLAFPLFIALASYFTTKQKPWLKFACLEIFFILHILLVWRFVNFEWAG